MSEAPPPPPPIGSTPLPPPPAPGLMAPPGRVDAAPTATVPLKRTGGVERAATIVVALAALFALAGVVVARTVTDDAQSFLDGEIDNDAFIEAITPYLLFSFVQGIAVLASAILVIIWMYRVAYNHAALHRAATWGPGWAIGGWFLPPLLYVIPFLMFRELWRASDPAVPIGGQWRSGRVSPFVTVWFIAYSLVPLGLLFFQGCDIVDAFGTSEEDMAEQFTGSQWAEFAGTLSTVIAAIAFVVMARRLGSRHRRLTGEDRA